MWRRIRIPIVALLVLSPLSKSDAALAQMLCGSRAEVLAQFARVFGEVPSAFGLTDQRSLLDVLVSPTGSWTMILTAPGGPTCVISTGQGWQTRPVAAEGPDA
jgi:hypothetical protein